MSMPTLHAILPHDARLRTQVLLDEADTYWFARHPDEPSRIRMYFRGERVDDHRTPTRHVVVSRDANGRLTRRFLAETAGDA